ncbi:hypothetical protein niasHT_016532 [Heterodera trifolii]|uniref:Nudix hydrolase domain-containing protein n=1 Tax=Heterodera trifolii TaxID=157864 RepID=A0ABD2L496_9BILA
MVDILRMTLRRLNLLNTESPDNEQQRERTENGPSQWPRAANEYVVLAGTANSDANPSTSSPPSQQTLPKAKETGSGEVMQSPRVPMSQIPSTHLRTLSTETAQSGERRETQLRTEKSLDDSLPPMRQHSAQQTNLNGEMKGTRKTDGMTSGAESEEHRPSPSSPQNGDAFDPSHSPAPPPLPPRTPRQNATQCPTESDAFPRTVLTRPHILSNHRNRSLSTYLLWTLGPKPPADAIVSRRLSNGQLQFVAIEQRDTGELALPGGMLKKGEAPTEAAVRGFSEETMGGDRREDKLEHFWKKGKTVYQEYVDDHRNTDNAWEGTTAVNIHDTDGLLEDIELEGGDDAKTARWVDVKQELLKLYASHDYLVHLFQKMHENPDKNKPFYTLTKIINS